MAKKEKLGFTDTNLLKSLRAKNGYTQEFVADVLGISPTSYCDKENDTKYFKLPEIEKLCILFSIKDINPYFFKCYVSKSDTNKRRNTQC